jgi:probable poly-beta-1,6-N-acetyl-D-glucosamine export protein
VKKIIISKKNAVVIRGISIFAVIVLHTISYLYISNNKQIFFIALDRLLRFCVPVFIVISGYGLAQKYQNKKIHYYNFIKKRAKKLFQN